MSQLIKICLELILVGVLFDISSSLTYPQRECKLANFVLSNVAIMDEKRFHLTFSPMIFLKPQATEFTFLGKG